MKNWLCPTVATLLGIGLVTVTARFIVFGNTVPSTDGRVAIALTQSERDLVLTEMRGFLAGVQTMTMALTRKDMETVARTAGSLGMQSTREVPDGMKGKLPLEFKRLGFSVHQDFDRMAEDARTLGDPDHTQRQLSDTLAKCVACHAGHRLVAVPAP